MGKWANIGIVGEIWSFGNIFWFHNFIILNKIKFAAFLNLNNNLMLESYTEAKCGFFQQFQFYNQQKWKVGEIWVVNARYLWFCLSDWNIWNHFLHSVVNLLGETLFVLRKCFNCSSLLSLCAIPSLRMHHH